MIASITHRLGLFHLEPRLATEEIQRRREQAQGRDIQNANVQQELDDCNHLQLQLEGKLLRIIKQFYGNV